MKEVGLRIGLNTSEAVAGVQNLSDTFESLSENIEKASKIGNTDFAREYEKQAQSIRQVKFEQANSGSSGAGSSGSFGGFGGKGVNGAVNTFNSTIGAAEQGSVSGLVSSGLAGAGALLTGPAGIAVAAAAGITAGIGKLSSFYSSRVEALTGLNAAINHVEREIIKEENFYKLSENDKNRYKELSNGWYIKKDDYKRYENDASMKQLENRLKASNELGFSVEESAQVARILTTYGLGDKSINKTNGLMGWISSKDVDKNSVASLYGTAYRFNSNKGSGDTLAQAWSVNNRMGLGRGQFQETIDILQSALSSSISSGFSKSIGEIGENLINLKNRSGGSRFWEGEEGFKKYSQIEGSLRGFRSLNNVNDIIKYRAINSLSEDEKKKLLGNRYIEGDSFTNAKMLAERGYDEKVISSAISIIEDMQGEGNTMGIISSLNDMFGLGTTSSVDFYNMYKNGKSTDLKSIINRAQGSPTNKTSNTIKQEVGQSLKNTAADFGSGIVMDFADLYKKIKKVVDSLGEFKTVIDEIKKTLFPFLRLKDIFDANREARRGEDNVD